MARTPDRGDGATTWGEDAMHLRECGGHVRHIHEAERAQHGVERGVWEVERLGPHA